MRFFQVLYRSLVIRRAFHIHDVFACHVHIHIFICLYVRTYVCVSLVCVSVVLLCESLWSKIHFAWMCAYASVCKHFCLTVDNVEKHDGIYMYGFVWIYIQEHFWGGFPWSSAIKIYDHEQRKRRRKLITVAVHQRFTGGLYSSAIVRISLGWIGVYGRQFPLNLRGISNYRAATQAPSYVHYVRPYFLARSHYSGAKFRRHFLATSIQLAGNRWRLSF